MPRIITLYHSSHVGLCDIDGGGGAISWDSAISDVLHASVKRDPTNFSTRAGAGPHSTFSRDRAAFALT